MNLTELGIGLSILPFNWRLRASFSRRAGSLAIWLGPFRFYLYW